MTKEGSAIVANGIELHILCIKRKDEKNFEFRDGIHIHRLPAGTNNYLLAFWDIVISIFFIHPLFYRKALQLLRIHNFSIIHAHDLPMVGTALAIKRKVGFAKVIFDMHENYPEALPLWFGWKKGFVVKVKNYLFMNTHRWLRWEAHAIAESDAVLTVVDEMKMAIEKKYGASDKVIVVSNTESANFLESPVDSNIYSAFKNKFIIAYVGGVGPHRGIDTVIASLPHVKQTDVIFVIVGGGSRDALDQLSHQVDNLRLQDRVFLLGHKPSSLVSSYMTLADINIIPHKRNSQNDHGVPHKLFQSMMSGKPVIVSSCPPLRRIIEETKAGLVFEAENEINLAEKIIDLYSDTEARKEFGMNGLQASSIGKFSWDYSAEKLINLYASIFH